MATRRSSYGNMSALALTTFALAAVAASAQTHRVAATQQVTRAIAVYEWTGDLAKPQSARLIPVSIYVDGGFHDAGTYYSRPVPLALETGNVYSLDRAGAPQGTLNLDFARHLGVSATEVTTNAADAGWFGYGSFVPLPKDKPSGLKTSAVVDDITGAKDDGPPSIKPPRNTPAARTSAPRNTPPPDTTSPNSTPDADPDRPTLRRHADPQASSDQSIKNGNTPAVTPVAGSLNDDPDRPTMQRGKSAAASAPPPLKGLPPALHQIAAVSDANVAEPHLFTREWESPKEEAATLAEMQTLAQPLADSYLRTNFGGLATTLATTTPAAPRRASTPAARSHASNRPASAPPPATASATLTEPELHGYTLSYGGLPTFVYTAIVPAPADTSAKAAAAPARPEVYVTVVAQRLPSGLLQIALSSVTDANHLDTKPWLRLVDAVDPDSEHRASLLFELRAQSSRQFALYRILSAQAEQLFITQPVQ